MNTTKPELAIEHLLLELEREILNASDEEILAIASELGMKPGMKGSISLAGVTRVVRLKNQHNNATRQCCKVEDRESSDDSHKNPKGDPPTSA